MSQNEPLVSIITPAYNRADYLPETIESVLNQAYANIEYLVLDDGSKDNTIEVLKRYEGRLKWESHANMGETKTVNKGFGIAQGKYVAIVNSDDPILPGLIRAAVDLLEANPGALVAYPDFVIIDQHGQPLEYRQRPDYNFVTMVRQYNCLPGPGAFIRRDAVEKIGGRNPDYRYVGDFDFWLRLALHGDFIRIPETLATWRDHPASATVAQRSPRMAEERIQLIEQFYANPNLPPEILQVKAEALSSAYYDAAFAVGGTAAARPYFWKSLRYHRNSQPLGQPRSWKLMLAALFLPSAWVDSLLQKRATAAKSKF